METVDDDEAIFGDGSNIILDIDRQVDEPFLVPNELDPGAGLGDLTPLLFTSALIVGLRYIETCYASEYYFQMSKG